MAKRGATCRTPVRTLLVALILLAAVIAPHAALAQGDDPPVLPAVLDDLSRREGRAITAGDLDGWRWSQRTFDDTSLGCPLPDEDYEPRPTSGYRIIVSFRGATYDYRVTRDGARVVLCPTGGVTPSPTPHIAAPTPLPTTPPTATPRGRDVCPDALPTRLAVGQSARAADRGAPIQLRAAPGIDRTVVGSVQPGQMLIIVSGPECGSSQVWWQVDYQRLIGWMFEAQNDVYWLEPLSGAPSASVTPSPAPTPQPGADLGLPPGRAPVTLKNALNLSKLINRPIEGTASAIAWSADGRTLAVTAQQGIWLFAARDFGAPPRLLRVSGSPVHAVSFNPAAGSGQMVTAHDDGTLRLWEVTTGGQTAVLTGHHAPVRALTFNPEGTLLASGGGAPGDPAAILLWDLTSPGPIGRLEGHSGPVRSLAFSPDGTLLASGADDHTVRLWDLVSQTPVAVLKGHSGPVWEVAFSPDAALIASTGEDGSIRLWDSAAGGGMALEDGGVPMRALAFVPADGLLVTGGGQNDAAVLGLWDVSQRERLGAIALPGAGDSAIVDLSFAASGAALAILTTGPSGSTLRLWGVPGES